MLERGLPENTLWLDDFRTFEWEKVFPSPELAIKKTRQLSTLI